MKAVCWYGANKYGGDDGAERKSSTRATSKVINVAICGSDLHIYGGYIPTVQQR